MIVKRIYHPPMCLIFPPIYIQDELCHHRLQHNFVYMELNIILMSTYNVNTDMKQSIFKGKSYFITMHLKRKDVVLNWYRSM